MREMIEDEEAWIGGYFSLEIGLGDIPVSTVRAFRDAIWQYPLVEGPYDKTNKGIATLPAGKTVCSSWTISLYDDFWLASFGLPMGGLDRIYPTGTYPFEEGNFDGFIMPVSDWLADLARHAFKSHPFPAAVTGFEVDFPVHDSPIQVPQNDRVNGYLIRSGQRLDWFPPTSNRALFS